MIFKVWDTYISLSDIIEVRFDKRDAFNYESSQKCFYLYIKYLGDDKEKCYFYMNINESKESEKREEEKFRLDFLQMWAKSKKIL